MILSFHPCFTGDENIICAGRDPGEADLAWIKKADAVILPQGCRQSLYEMAKNHCPHVFPNYHARFRYPGKIGQIKLFAETNVPCPKTGTFSCLKSFYDRRGTSGSLPAGIGFPCVFKFDWGGEGDNVLFIDTPKKFLKALELTGTYERTGQQGFLIQEYIPSGGRSLRVVIIGGTILSYWRVQTDPRRLVAGVSRGAKIDEEMDADLQKIGRDMVNAFCRKTGINLAGFDLIFPHKPRNSPLFFLEINYFFGRVGLGGSEPFYRLLNAEIKKWLDLTEIS